MSLVQVHDQLICCAGNLWGGYRSSLLGKGKVLCSGTRQQKSNSMQPFYAADQGAMRTPKKLANSHLASNTFIFGRPLFLLGLFLLYWLGIAQHWCYRKQRTEKLMLTSRAVLQPVNPCTQVDIWPQLCTYSMSFYHDAVIRNLQNKILQAIHAKSCYTVTTSFSSV